jgi:hypothetical protein
MALEGAWTRGRPSKGLRQVNIRYEVDDGQWRDIEDLLERVPYKKVNEVMRYALLLGSKVLLSTNQDSREISKVPAAGAGNKAAPSPPPSISSNHESSGKGTDYSQTAKSMFQKYGSKE